MDKLTIYNRALSLIAAAPYQPSTGVQHPCDLWYTHAINKANERADWSFARRRATLHETQSSIPNNQSSIVNRQSSITNSQSSIVNSQFTLPADCLNLRNVYYHGTRTKTTRRETYGRTLITDTTPAVDIDYTSNILTTLQELPDAAPTFCQAVIYLLASLIAPEIKGQTSQEHERYAALYEQEIQQAAYLDLKQTEANDQSPLPAILSRKTW